MRFKIQLFLVSLLFSWVSVDAQELIAVDVYVEARGKGTTGTVVELTVRIAPEDLALVGSKIRLRADLLSFGSVVDDLSTELTLDAGGSATLYREWPPGFYDLKVTVSSLARPVIGLSSGQVEIPEAEIPFELPVAATEAPAIGVTPPRKEALHFIPIPDLESLEAFHLEVSAPDGTAFVEFYRNSKLFERRKRPPWSVRVPTRTIVQRSEIRAIALDGMGRYLGEDVIVINNPAGETGVEILLAPDNAVRDGQRPITIAITDRRDVRQVSLHLDDKMVVRWETCPCVTEIPITDLQNTAVVSAEVVDTEGNRFVEVSEVGGGFRGAVWVDLVELQVQVFDSHRVPVIGLDRQNFSVFDDGQEIEIDGVGTLEDQPLSLAIAVDSSSSMTAAFAEVRQAVSGFAENLLTRNDRAALIRFASETEVLVSWSNDPKDVGHALAGVIPGGSTSLNDAIIHSLMEIHSLRGRKALVVLTDGADTSSFSRFADTAWFSRSMRIPIFPITLFNGDPSRYARSMDIPQVVNRHRLDSLANKTGGRAFFRITVDQLPAVYEEISDILRSQYVVWYRPNSNNDSDAFRSIKVKVDKPKLKVRTISGYYPGR